MKKILIIGVLIAFIGCKSNQEKPAVSIQPQDGSSATKEQVTADNGQKDHVELLYFHGAKRCKTCLAIEELTQEVINEHFAQEIAEGTLVYRIIDISKPKNEAIADRYEVSWSSLWMNKWEHQKEMREDLTEFAFTNANSEPGLYKETLTAKINQLLQN